MRIALGRAGRPQFDTCGVAIIMTSQETYLKWNDLSSGRLLITSKLQEEFAEHLNAEVALGTVQNAEQAVLWFESTFWGLQTPPERMNAAREYIRAELDKLGAFLFSLICRRQRASNSRRHSAPWSHDRRSFWDLKKYRSGRCNGKIWHASANRFILYDGRYASRFPRATNRWAAEPRANWLF